ncbi:MAG: hypothetical protein RIR95_2306, partial [Pseudomonadota bacterium]
PALAGVLGRSTGKQSPGLFSGPSHPTKPLLATTLNLGYEGAFQSKGPPHDPLRHLHLRHLQKGA